MAAKKKPAPDVALAGIKGFDSDLRCRGFQFVLGETFTHAGAIKACKSGFHAVTGHPLAVFGYYAPAGSRFCRVELSGNQNSDDGGEKTAAAILKVGQEIGLSDLVQDAVKWVTDRATLEGETATGYQGAASATGTQGAASATGYQGAASATGTQGAASATGTQGAAMSSGCGGRVSGKTGNAIFACERDTWDGPILSVASGIVGRDGIKEGVWYAARAGKLAEAS